MELWCKYIFWIPDDCNATLHAVLQKQGGEKWNLTIMSILWLSHRVCDVKQASYDGGKNKTHENTHTSGKKVQSKTETVSRCRSFLSQLSNKMRWVHIYTQAHKCLHLVTALPTCVTRAPHFDIRTTEKLLHDCPGRCPTAVSTLCILKLQDKT